MATIDYGALLRVDGKLINRGQMFMDSSDTGYICEKALHSDGKYYDIDGDYFVYAGDQNFMIVFYKGSFKVISHEKVILSEWNMGFASYTYFLHGLPTLKVSRLSKKRLTYDSWRCYESYDEFLKFSGSRSIKKYLRIVKRIGRDKRVRKGYYPYRFLAEWYYDGRHYEVIFGYGIDTDENVWKRIRNDSYDFNEDEKEIIDRWFYED